MKGAEQVCVCFEGKQVDAAGEESSTMLSVTGWRFLRGASRYVQYDDTALLPGSTISTVLRIRTDEVMLRRCGSVSWMQHFIADRCRRSDYHTPYGTFCMMTHTHDLRLCIFENGSEEVFIAYTLYVDDVKQSDNTLLIRIAPLPDKGDYCGYKTAD